MSLTPPRSAASPPWLSPLNPYSLSSEATKVLEKCEAPSRFYESPPGIPGMMQDSLLCHDLKKEGNSLGITRGFLISLQGGHGEDYRVPVT